MATLSNILLKPGEADRVVAGHPWIYEGSILRLTRPAKDGDLVQVKDHRQRLLGVGFYNSQSRIRVRMLSSRRESVDQAFFEQRFRKALAVRKRHLPDASSFRLVNSESDFLSGLVIDKYVDLFVIQITSLGMEQRKPLIVSALNACFQPRAILERSDTPARTFEGLKPSEGTLSGSLPDAVDIYLNELTFGFQPCEGHKTGLYLDQQENYRRVADLARRCDVKDALDAFCFQGGFAVHLASAGVASVMGIDQSEPAIEQARLNAKRNGFDGACTFESANVFDWLKEATKGNTEGRFDLVVLDPPTFTRNRRSVPDALRGYKEIHLRAMRLLRPGGILATFCCSHHVDAGLYLDVNLSAAYDARRQLRRVAVYTQSPDHPVLPAIAETEYLKGFAFEVI